MLTKALSSISSIGDKHASLIKTNVKIMAEKVSMNPC